MNADLIIMLLAGVSVPVGALLFFNHITRKVRREGSKQIHGH